jgi:hypothetical protein
MRLLRTINFFHLCFTDRSATAKRVAGLALQVLIYSSCLAQPMGHSHNDYLQKYPLTSAIENEMSSIEVDIVVRGDLIFVSHETDQVDSARTIQSMYFNPLKSRFIEGVKPFLNDGDEQLQLLIDLKTEGPADLDVLHRIVSDFDLLFERKDREVGRPIRIVLSGSVPKARVLDKPDYPYFFIDGRISDLQYHYSSLEMPVISANYNTYFSWRGSGEPPGEERHKLLKLIADVHQQGKLIRFWGTPDTVEFWRYLADTGVDFINVDDIEGFRNFQKSYNRN